MAHCPVEECSEVKEVKASLRRWGTAIVTSVLVVGGIFFVTWARASRVPNMELYSEENRERLISLEAQFNHIIKNTEEIKEVIKQYHKPQYVVPEVSHNKI